MKRIFISYNVNEKETYHFWEMFFQLCGIWVSPCFQEFREPEMENEMHLWILGTLDVDRVKPKAEKNIVYIKKGNSTFQKYKNRKDIIELKWSDKENSSFKQVINLLFLEHKDAEQLNGILDLFREYRFWGTMWLFHELAVKDQSRFDDRIVKSCQEFLSALQGRALAPETQYVKYMSLYCEYMMKSAEVRSLTDRTLVCKSLITKCEETAQEIGWTPALELLMGKICEMSPAEIKYAISFYESVVEYEEKAQILYDIGHIYETICGEWEKASKYYEKTYLRDENYYRGLYKIALFEERSDEWKRALKCYGKILSILEIIGDDISVYGMMYEYKVKRRLREIFRRYFSGLDLSDIYSMQITDFRNDLKNYSDVNLNGEKVKRSEEKFKNFDRLFHCMFGNEDKAIKKRVLTEVLERLDELCLKM